LELLELLWIVRLQTPSPPECEAAPVGAVTISMFGLDQGNMDVGWLLPCTDNVR